MVGESLSAASAATMLLTRAGQVTCALPIGQVVETMRPLPIEPVAGAPAFVLGLAVIRGVALPVVELARVLGTATGASAASRFVVIRTGERRVALSVDAVLGVRAVIASGVGALPPLLAAADRAAITAIGTLDAELLVVLDASRVLPAEPVAGAP
jgi:purine-binding chemotaxis protein CheW